MDPFIHFPAQGLLVCSKCKHAVLPGHVDVHLKDSTTHKMPKSKRQTITREIQQLPGLILDRQGLNQLVIPPAGHPAIPVLQPARSDGMQCQEGVCCFISCHADQIRKHYREKHSWKNPQKKGGQKKGEVQEVLPIP
jgi:hypothetical protein